MDIRAYAREVVSWVANVNVTLLSELRPGEWVILVTTDYWRKVDALIGTIVTQPGKTRSRCKRVKRNWRITYSVWSIWSPEDLLRAPRRRDNRKSSVRLANQRTERIIDTKIRTMMIRDDDRFGSSVLTVRDSFVISNDCDTYFAILTQSPHNYCV